MSDTHLFNGCYKWKLCLRLSCILLILYCCREIKGLVEVSPPAVAPVCQAGDEVELTCSSSGRIQRWEVTVPQSMTQLALTAISSIGPGGIFQTQINNSTFIVSRLSGEDILPVMTTIVVNPVSSDLNGTVVNCFEGSTSTESVATTTIRIIDPGQFELSIQLSSEQFSSDGVTVTLEWTLLNSQDFYQQFLRDISVSADPQLKHMMPTSNMGVQVVLSYNTPYNVSVTQHSTCRQLIRTKFILLNYIKCSNPMELTNALALDYVDPAREGQNITFSCPPGQTLNGSNSSTCMGNREWEPDPREVECTGTPVTTTTSQQTTVSCTPKDDCPEERTGTSQGTAIVLGVIFGILVPAAATIVVVILIIIWNKKRLSSDNVGQLKYTQNTGVELDNHANDTQDHKDEGTLVYADIGQRPAAPVKSNINTHLLDDNRVDYALLDHSVHKHKEPASQEISVTKKSDNCPNVNLDNLLIQLRPQVGPKWYQFGEAAGIEKEVLDKIAELCRTPDECIVELFDHWLRNSIEPPTWRNVADMLKAINFTELGRDIEEVYTTGTLPIVVDMNQVPKLEPQEEETPPPLPARSGNEYIDAPFHTVQATSQGLTNPRAAPPPPPPSNEIPAPALPPKPPRNKLVGT